MTSRGRTTAGVTILAAAAIAIAGCTGASGGGTGTRPVAQAPADVVSAAFTKTTGAKTAKVEMDVKITTAGAEPVAMTGKGLVDLTSGATDLTMTVPGFGELGLRVVGGAMYTKLPADLLRGMGAKPWVKIDAAAAASIGMEQLGQMSPTQQLAYLKGVSRDVTTVGKEKLAGTDTTHYRVTIDLDKAAAAAGPEAKKSLQEAEKALGSARLPADLWIDGDGRLRKFTTTMKTTAPKNPSVVGVPTAAGPATVAVTQTFSDFGTPVAITAPPAGEVTDMSALLGQK